MKKRILCFGEILWDMLPEGKVLGGAPLNVLFHARQNGLLGKMISGIGADDLGREIKDRCAALNLSLELVQEHQDYPTGVADVSLDENGSASYELVQPVAYDNIQLQPSQEEHVTSCDAFVFGSLANRGNVTRSTLISLLRKLEENPQCTIFFDVNLRAPHYDLSVISELMTFANVVKLNDEELQKISDFHQISGAEEERMNGLLLKFNLNGMVCTLGGDGAIYVDNNKIARVHGKKINLVDTVGSGDAFLAAFIASYLDGEPISKSLEKANNLGAFIASKRGAIVTY